MRVIDLAPHPDPTVDVVIGDIADPDVLTRAFDGGFDSIVHLAAVTSVLRSVQEPERTFRTNVVGTNAVLAAGREAGVTSLAFTSTNAVTGPMTAPKISEAAVLNPLTPYGSTKAAGEMLMSAYTASYGLRCACDPSDQRVRTRDAGEGQHRRSADAGDPARHDVRDLRRRQPGPRLPPRLGRRRRRSSWG